LYTLAKLCVSICNVFLTINIILASLQLEGLQHAGRHRNVALFRVVVPGQKRLRGELLRE
jgi:hypothetical protein